MNEAKRKLILGNNISVWWPRDQRTYDATIMKLSNTGVEILYNDGTLKKYDRKLLVQRIAAASACESPIQHSIMRHNLHVGSSISIWSPRHRQTRKATITKMSKVHVTVVYVDSGKSKDFVWETLLPNMLPSDVAKSCSALEAKTFDSCLGVGSSIHDATATRELIAGNKIQVFWPRDGRSYQGVVTKVSKTHADVLYDDGHRKTYPLGALLAAARQRALQTTISVSSHTPYTDTTATHAPQTTETKRLTQSNPVTNAAQKLGFRVGVKIPIWSKEQHRSLWAVIENISDTHVHVKYEDGTRRTHTISVINKNPRNLHVGQRIDIYWPGHNQSQSASIIDISDSLVDVEYDDGMTKSYRLSELLQAQNVAVCRILARLSRANKITYSQSLTLIKQPHQ